jgi:hypothetical protein
MKIKFLRNVLVYAEHREAGSIHEIKDSDAIQLINDRAATKFIEPEKAKPEKATAKHEGKENASK